METPIINPLGSEKISKLLLKFAIPSVIGMLVNALYNIVDQIFIGQGVGILGNAATNVAFPLTTICTAIGLLFGVGGASSFNLELGAGEKEKAGRLAGTSLTMLGILGLVLALIVIVFLQPLMYAFGASEQVLPYALSYTGIVAFGFPFLILSTGASNLIRADGKPMYSMICLLTGAVINVFLDAFFMFVLNMGIAGAALATVISQIISCGIALAYFRRFQSVSLKREYFRPALHRVKLIATLGLASCFNQVAMSIVQIAMNNTLTYYGARSVYGSDIPLACVGVLSKVNIIFISFVVGVSQGAQPIIGFNYGARQYQRVRETLKLVLKTVTTISVIAFILLQLFPIQILTIFGQGNELYYEFGKRYIRLFMLFTFLNGVQPAVANFFNSIGKATTGIFISLTRQVLFLLPLILVFPLIFGINGVMYAGPIADAASIVTAAFLLKRELGLIRKAETAAG